MAGARQSKAYHRRQQEARERRVQRRVTLAALGVLLVVAIVVAVGIVMTVVLPPRAHVLRVGNRDFTARDIANRAQFAVQGGDQSVLSNPATTIVEALTREETLLQAGAVLVDPITAEDLNQEIRTRLGVADDATVAQFAEAYQSFLRGIPLSQAAFERLSRAQLIRDRLLEQFTSEVPSAGLQFHLEAVQAANQEQLKTFHDAVAGGADFGAKAVELGLATEAASVDLGWALLGNLGSVKDVVMALSPGQVTEVVPIQDGTASAVFRLVERAEQRDYDETQRTQLGNEQLNTWMDQLRAPLHVRVDLSASEQRWIAARVQQAAKDAPSLPALPSGVPTATPSATPPATPEASPSATPSASPIATPTASPSATPTAGG